MKLSERSLERLEGVHPELISVPFKRAAETTTVPFIITSGVRTAAQQNALYKRGASKLDGYHRKSRHQQGCAFDVAVTDDHGNVTWDWPPYTALSKVIKQAARDLGVPIEWGGDWKSFKDGPHYQLPRRYVREYIADPVDDSRPVLKLGSSGTFVQAVAGQSSWMQARWHIRTVYRTRRQGVSKREAGLSLTV